MARAYTKEDVIGAALLRFSEAQRIILAPIYDKFYDEKGKDEFRKYASVTPQAMKDYFEGLKK